MLLLKQISEAAEITPAPPEVQEMGLREVIGGLLTRDPATRLTLAQLRLNAWLTDYDKQPLPLQPESNVKVSPEEIEQAVTNRSTIKFGSASGPSALGAALSLCGTGDSTFGWLRIGSNTIRKRSNLAEANFYRAIAASGHLAPHLPIIYSISGAESSSDEFLRLSATEGIGREGGASSSGHANYGAKPKRARSSFGLSFGGSLKRMVSFSGGSPKRMASFGGSSPKRMASFGGSSPKRMVSLTATTSSDGAAAMTLLPREAASTSAAMATSGLPKAVSFDLPSGELPRFDLPSGELPSVGGADATDAAVAIVADAAVAIVVEAGVMGDVGGGDLGGGDPSTAPAPVEAAPTVTRAITTRTAAPSRSLAGTTEDVVHILMGDLVTGMSLPCAMSFLMGVRTATANDLGPEQATPNAALGGSMRSMAPERAAQMLTAEEKEAGAVPLHRYLEFLDTISTSRTLGFRIDAAKTVVNGALDLLPLPEGMTLNTLSDEAQIAEAIAIFLQRDAGLAAATLLKLKTLEAALLRSSFFARHVFLRTTMLLVFDDAHRAKGVDLKIMNFGSSYALPQSMTVKHTEPWDGTAECHEDGYLTGVRSLLRVVQSVCDALASPAKVTPAAADKAQETTGSAQGGAAGAD
jgi:hypothetical protein